MAFKIFLLLFIVQEGWAIAFFPRTYSQSSEFYQGLLFLSLCIGLIIWWLKTSLPRAIRDKKIAIAIMLLVISGAMIFPVFHLTNFLIHEYKPHEMIR